MESHQNLAGYSVPLTSFEPRTSWKQAVNFTATGTCWMKLFKTLWTVQFRRYITSAVCIKSFITELKVVPKLLKQKPATRHKPEPSSFQFTASQRIFLIFDLFPSSCCLIVPQSDRLIKILCLFPISITREGSRILSWTCNRIEYERDVLKGCSTTILRVFLFRQFETAVWYSVVKTMKRGTVLTNWYGMINKPQT